MKGQYFLWKLVETKTKLKMIEFCIDIHHMDTKIVSSQTPIKFQFNWFWICLNWLVLTWNFTLDVIWYLTLAGGWRSNKLTYSTSHLHFIQCEILRIVFKVEKKWNTLFSTLTTQMETPTSEQMEPSRHSRSCYRVIGTSWSGECCADFVSWCISAPSLLCHSEFVCM